MRPTPTGRSGKLPESPKNARHIRDTGGPRRTATHTFAVHTFQIEEPHNAFDQLDRPDRSPVRFQPPATPTWPPRRGLGRVARVPDPADDHVLSRFRHRPARRRHVDDRRGIPGNRRSRYQRLRDRVRRLGIRRTDRLRSVAVQFDPVRLQRRRIDRCQ